ncbi:hypothetical protein CDD80_7385 [Ophiocordyceps camponoti-rufipedis]|uniref:Uncharacterized protein n=1 Tax=Ophiocordyceps camponoti-rufipedis TaxID=2004952 RepID=A0A2C5ZEE7_9HYPO|nr:hypothetical protein CDD80_7385 [Ophiocordyceps camponoti-rufipedis]
MDDQQPPSLPRAAKPPLFLHRRYHESSRRRHTSHETFHQHSSYSEADGPDDIDDSSAVELELRTLSDEQPSSADNAIDHASDHAADHAFDHAPDIVSDTISDIQPALTTGIDPQPASADNLTSDPAARIAYAPPQTVTSTEVPATASSSSISTAVSTSHLSSIQSTPWPAVPSPNTSSHAILSDLRNVTNAMPKANSSLAASHLSTTSPPSNSTILSLNFSSPTTSPFDVSLLAASTSLTSKSTESQSTLVTTTGVTSETTESADSQTSSVFTTDDSSSLPTITSTSSEGGVIIASEPTGSVPPDRETGAGSKAAAPSEALPTKERVIGSVVGSVAGVAFIMLLAILALKYNKKRKNGRHLLGGNSGPTTPRAIAGPGSTTAEASVPQTRFAGSRGDEMAEQGDERGFYRVAGRKLPPVLMTGGDGFSDPRDTLLSDSTADFRRTSQALDSMAGSLRPLALGAPMRPVSGIPIIRSGPARTPVTQNPFADPPTSPSAQDGSPGWRDRSRFHEGI